MAVPLVSSQGLNPALARLLSRSSKFFFIILCGYTQPCVLISLDIQNLVLNTIKMLGNLRVSSGFKRTSLSPHWCCVIQCKIKLLSHGINVAQQVSYLGFQIRKSVSSVARTNYTNISKNNRSTSKGHPISASIPSRISVVKMNIWPNLLSSVLPLALAVNYWMKLEVCGWFLTKRILLKLKTVSH